MMSVRMSVGCLPDVGRMSVRMSVGCLSDVCKDVCNDVCKDVCRICKGAHMVGVGALYDFRSIFGRLTIGCL